MTQARIATERLHVYELVELTGDARFILADPEGRVRVFEESSSAEMIEIQCDECGRWTPDAYTRGRGRWLCPACYPPYGH